MIAAIIVIVSIIFAGAFTIAYLVRPALRRQIEAPKFIFQEQIRQYNAQPKPANAKSANDAYE